MLKNKFSVDLIHSGNIINLLFYNLRIKIFNNEAIRNFKTQFEETPLFLMEFVLVSLLDQSDHERTLLEAFGLKVLSY